MCGLCEKSYKYCSAKNHKIKYLEFVKLLSNNYLICPPQVSDISHLDAHLHYIIYYKIHVDLPLVNHPQVRMKCLYSNLVHAVSSNASSSLPLM